MKSAFKLPITDRLIARKVAAAFVRNEFNVRKAVGELVPTLVHPGPLGAKLMAEPAVRYEIGVIMDRVDKKDGRAAAFLNGMHAAIELYESYIKDPTKGLPPKHVVEVAQTAMRILAKGYIREKGPVEKESTPPMKFEGLEDGINNLTGDTPVPVEQDPEKVM